jgi:hypothetical protein
MKRQLAILTLVIAASPVVFAQTSERNHSKPNPNRKAEQEVLMLDRANYDALIRMDTAYLDRMTAEDFAETRSFGSLLSKAQVMQFLKSGRVKVLSYETEDVQVRIYGNTALVTGQYSRKERVKDREGKEMEYEQRGRYIDVWVKRKGHWQIVYNQDTNAEQSKK